MKTHKWSEGKKSKIAVWAEEEKGMRTKSKITAEWLREGGITENVEFIKFLIRIDYIKATDRYYTNMYFKETAYYSTEDIAEQLEDLENLREIYADPKLRNSSKRDIYRALILKDSGGQYDRFDDDFFDVRRGVAIAWPNYQIVENFTITIDWPGGQIIAKNIYEAESQIRSLQTFGSYPMWSWTDTWKPPKDKYTEDEYAKIAKSHGISGWQRFDNAVFQYPEQSVYFGWVPSTHVRDLRQYLVWSLSGAIELSDVKVTIDGDFTDRQWPTF